MERDFVRLAASVKEGFDSLRREIEIDRDHDERRHQENSHRLDLINGRVGRAHDRASALEALVATLSARVESIATRTHHRMNEVQTWIGDTYDKAQKLVAEAIARVEGRSERSTDHGDAEKDVVTGSRLRFYLWCFVGGFLTAVALGRALGKF